MSIQSQRIHLRCFHLFIIVSILLSGCFGKAQDMVGTRPASRLPAVVEAYLEKFQPGPLPRLFQTTYIYDRHGVQLAELFEEGRRTWVSLGRISQNLIDATIATEDATFYENIGIDPFRIAVAAWQNRQGGRVLSGASTITMQLARNLFLGPEDRYNPTMDRKLLEAGLAQELTARYTKAEVLEMYLNLLNYGNLAYGPEAAASTYFNKHAEELTLPEATFLAGIPQSPGNLNPYRNFRAVKQRQRIVLNLLVKHGYLSAFRADWAYRQPINLRQDISPPPVVAPHFVQYVIQSIDSRMGEGYTQRSGFNLFTTLDLNMQTMAEQIIREKLSTLRPEQNLGNAALVAMRVGTGEVLAFVGSADFHDASIDGQVNMALSPRQPGSTLKPLLFATAFHDNLISPATILWDTPVTYDLGLNQVYRPQNYDEQFHGLVTARAALANSYNIPAVRLLSGIGIERMVESARAMGAKSLTEGQKWYGLALALGSNEASLVDMVTAYHTLANGGSYIPPEVALTVLDSQSQLINPLPAVEPIQAISPAAAFLATDIMSDNDARTPMFGANSLLKLSKPAAVKTGTTNDFRDNWTIGFTRQLAVGIWSGNANGQPMRASTGVTGAAPIWHEFMEAILADPALLNTMKAPPLTDANAWEFMPPADVKLLDECPPRAKCHNGREYFSQAWLDLAGAAGPLADSFEQQPTAPVYVNRFGGFWPIFCTQPGGQMRTVLRLSNTLGLPNSSARAAVNAATQLNRAKMPSATMMESLSVTRINNHYEVTFFPENELERMRKLRWSRYHGLAVSLGDCASLAYYTVQPGDHWSKLSSRFSVTLDELQTANPHVLRDEEVLQPGDRLLVPNGVKIELSNQGKFYTVQEGDSWMKISTEFDLPLKLLQIINPDVMRPGLILKPGDELFIPAGIPKSL